MVCGVASSTVSAPSWGSDSGRLGAEVSASISSLGAGSERQVEIGDWSVTVSVLSEGRAGGKEVKARGQ